MRLLRATLCTLLLGAFCGLVTLQAYHRHTNTPATSSDCQICKIAHQAPALVDRPTLVPQLLSNGQAPRFAIASSNHPFLFIAHGLAPPSL